MSTWPAIMPNPSKDLKRCLCKSGEEADTKTLKKKLMELGYNPSVKFIRTAELEERIEKMYTSSGQQFSFSEVKTNDDQIENALG